MKNFTNNLKQITSRLSARWLIMALMMLVGTSSAWAITFKGNEILYLTPCDNWITNAKNNGNGKPGRYAAYFFGNGEKWISMTAVAGETELYEVTAPANYTQVIFCSMNPTTNGLSWNDKWNQTNDLTYDGTNNHYTVKAGTWDKGGGTWSIYTPPCAKETPIISISADKNPICPDETATLTATITDLSANNNYSIQWYDSNGKIDGEINNTYQPTATGNYYVVVTGDCVEETTSEEIQFIINQKPTLQSTLENNNTNVEICGTGNATLSVTPGFVSYSWGEGNTKTVNATGKYTVTATDGNGCTSNEVEFDVKVLNPTVTLVSDADQTVCNRANANFEVILANGQSVSWKEADGTEVSTSNPFTPQIAGEAGTTYTYKVVVSEGSCSSEESTVSATIQTIDLTVGSISGDNEICSGNATTLTLSNMTNGNVVKWLKSTDNNNYSDVSNTTTTLNTENLTTNTYYKAQVSSTVCPNHIESTEPYLVTVNPLPTITSISASNDEPVPFEDVVLTAEDTDAKTINWSITSGDGELSENTGTSVVLTSSTAGTVTVTATATSEADCTFATTKTVTFSAENCTPVASNDIQIKFYHPIEKSTDDAKKGQWWGMGTLYYSTNNSTWSSIDMGSEKSGTHTETISNISKSTLYVYFQSYWTYSHESKAKSNTLTLERGKKYDIKITRHGDNNINATATATETGSLTKNPDITAPAVKMVSVEYDEVNDKIVAKGAVYKTGCGETFWGFQYSTYGQTWGTADADFIRPSTGNSLSVPGEFDYSFAIPNAGGGDIYYIRAYALNNYNGSYALSNAVYSATSLPVEIPSSTIESATISLVDSEGATEVCPQSTVYLKVSYVGGDFKSFEAADNFPGTNLELVNHDKAKDEAIFSYTATATGIANITISNNNTSITTTNGVSITLMDVAPVNAPMISISQATICEGGNATITVNNPIEGLTYTLYKETTKIAGPITYYDGALTFNVTEAGSYTVRAEESVCNNYANSMPVELKVVTSDVKIGLAVDKETVNPWQPLKLTVTAPEGYAYTIDALNDVVYTQAGNVYTVKIPRPEGWTKGNSGTPVKTKDVTFEAKIQVTDDLTCGSSSITVKLEDTEENCK